MDLLIELPAVDIGHSWQEEYRTVPDSSVCFIFFPTTSIYSSLNSDWKQKKVCTKSLQSCPLFVTLWTVALCVRVLVAQSCLTLWDPMDYSPPGSVLGILQARILKRVAISFFTQVRIGSLLALALPPATSASILCSKDQAAVAPA